MSEDLVWTVVIVAIVPLYLWSVIFAYRDARARGKSGCLVALIVMFLEWPIGLLVWLVFRPEGEPTEQQGPFLVRCECGHKLRIGAGQAGERIACGSCGRNVVVPPLSQLTWDEG